jgi:hypothetical protein
MYVFVPYLQHGIFRVVSQPMETESYLQKQMIPHSSVSLQNFWGKKTLVEYFWKSQKYAHCHYRMVVPYVG